MTTSIVSVSETQSKIQVNGVDSFAFTSTGLAVTGTVTGLNLSGTNTGDQTNISGNAATATDASLLNSISAVNLSNNMGQVYSTATSFDAAGGALTRNFGKRFVQGSINGPGTNGASQYYSEIVGLGSDYAFNTYAMQMAWPRNAAIPYVSIRYEEAGVLGAWQKISAGYADTAGNAATVTTNANLTGHITSVGNATALGSFTLAQINTAISDADVATGGGTATGTNTGDQTNISGNAATATTATNQSGGTVNATTGAFSGLVVGATSVSTDINAANDTGSFSARGNTTTVASMSFHRAGAFAINVGLSNSNNFVIGGWSAAANAFSMSSVGALTMQNNITAFSDERVKTNWRPLTSNFIEQLALVKHGIYDRIDQVSTQVGVSAQSLQKILDPAVMEDSNGYLSVAYGNAAMVSAIKLAERVVDQDARITKLEALVMQLISKIG